MSAVIAGIGLVTPLGRDAADVLRRIARGEHAFVDGEQFRSARVADLPQGAGRATALARVAAEAALADAGLTWRDIEHVFVGTCSGAMFEFETWHRGETPYAGETYAAIGEGLVAGLRHPHEASVREIDHVTPSRGPSVTTFSSACTSGLTALHFGRLAIEGGAGRILVVAADAMCAFAASGFTALRAVAPDRPWPFHPESRGMGLGEGAAALVLSPGDGGLRVESSALSCDAFHRTRPRPDASTLLASVTRACGDRPIDAYVAHGTGTPANDAAEHTLLDKLGWLDQPVLAHKGALGHAMGASGLISYALAAQWMRSGGGAFGVAYDVGATKLRLSGTLATPRRAVVVSAAFGGANAVATLALGQDPPRAAISALASNRVSARVDAPRSRLASDTAPTRYSALQAFARDAASVAKRANATYGLCFGDAWQETPVVTHPRAGRLERAALVAHAALQRLPEKPRGTVGLFIGSEWGSFAANMVHADELQKNGFSGVSPLTFPATVPSSVAGELAITLGAQGPAVTIVGRDVATRLWELARASLQAGDCDEAIVGVVEAWHPRMSDLELTRDALDGAVLAHLKRSDL